MLWITIFLALPFVPRAEDRAADPAAQAYRLYLHGELGKAAELYRTESRKNTSPVESCLDGSTVLQDLGRNMESIEMLRHCLKTAPSDGRLLSALAWAQFHEGDLTKAKETFAKTQASDSARPLNLLGMAQVALEQKDQAGALELLDRLAAARPRLALTYFYKAKALEAQNKWDDSVAAYQKVLKEDSHFVEARPHLARIHERQKQFDDAWKHHARIALVDPKNRKAQEGKGKLEPLLTKRPDEIIPVKTLPQHSSVEPAPDWEKNLVLKVGIGTNAGGGLAQRKTVAFRAAGAFAITDSQTGKELVKGGGGEAWVIRVDPRDPASAEIIGPQGKQVGTFRKSIRIKQEGQERRTTIIERLTYAPGYAWGGTADRELRGEIEISLSAPQKSLIVINHVNLEEYVYGVLNSEMPTHWPMEALKAQAVLARTQAVYRQKALRPHRAYGYDLCDEQHCQVYGGVPAETKRAKSAVNDTRGQILTYNENPAHTIFFSNCGGHTQSGKEVGWADVAYWQGVFDGKDPAQAPNSPWKLKEWLKTEPAVYCNASKYIWSPEFRWTRVISADDLESRVSRIKSVGRIKALVPLRRSRSGHLNALKIQGTSGDLVVDREHEIRRVLALGPLRSTLFVIETSYRNGRAQSFTFYGGGWGHGVGMCQAGAGGRAEQGVRYQEILSHYYPGTRLGAAGPLESGKEGKRE